MKTVCKYLGIGTAVLGVLSSIGMAYVSGISIKESLYGIDFVRNWPLTIFYFCLGLFVTAAFTSVLLGISEILERLNALKELNTDELDMPENKALAKLAQIEANTFWKCPTCGKNNPPYTGTCSCGQVKP